MRASGVSLSFHHMSHHPLTLAASLFCLFCLCLVPVFVGWVWCLLPVCKSRVLDLDDRQGFTARSATQ